MKTNDIILIIILLFVSFTPLISSKSSANSATITINNEHYKTVNLNEDNTFVIKNEYGENTVEVKNNSISVIKTDCKDNICVKSGKIKNTGEVIACIPHKLLIEIRDEDD